MERSIDITKLTLEELSGVVNIYPWFSLARKELCRRMNRLGDWGETQFADAAMYMGDRKVLSALLREVSAVDCSDADVEKMVRMFMEPEPQTVEEPVENGKAAAAPVAAAPAAEAPRRVRFAGADYFSQAEYAKVRQAGDSSIIDYYAKGGDSLPASFQQDQDADICTETMARIYLEQGYLDEARDIYSKLILAYPEKNAYFAALIGKIDEIKS